MTAPTAPTTPCPAVGTEPRKVKSPHAAGYAAYISHGLGARNPFDRAERSAAQWQAGFDKARREQGGDR